MKTRKETIIETHQVLTIRRKRVLLRDLGEQNSALGSEGVDGRSGETGPGVEAGFTATLRDQSPREASNSD